MVDTSFHNSTTLLMLGSLDPYWESQLLMEYSKDLFTCKVLDGKVMDGRYKVVEESFIPMISPIWLENPSSRRNYLMQPMRSFFQNSLASLEHIILSYMDSCGKNSNRRCTLI